MEALAKNRNPEPEGKEKERFTPEELDKLAESLGVGALVFNELKNRRLIDTKFDLDSILSFEGDTGPYIQFAHVRLAGILRKVGMLPDPAKARWELLGEPQTEDVLSLLTQFGERIDGAVEGNEPSSIAQYALELAEKIHSFTHHHRVLDVEATPERLLLVMAAKKTLAAALTLLGLDPVERM